jgi:hypothetical protein
MRREMNTSRAMALVGIGLGSVFLLTVLVANNWFSVGGFLVGAGFGACLHLLTSRM